MADHAELAANITIAALQNTTMRHDEVAPLFERLMSAQANVDSVGVLPFRSTEARRAPLSEEPSSTSHDEPIVEPPVPAVDHMPFAKPPPWEDFEPVKFAVRRPHSWDEGRQRRFIELVARTKSVVDSARAVGMSDNSFRNLLYRPDSDSLRAAYGRALEIPVEELPPEREEPEVDTTAHLSPDEIAASHGDDFIKCLECGRTMAVLGRHLKAAHDLTPETYKAKWGLPDDYPMITPELSRRQSAGSKERYAAGIGLSQTKINREKAEEKRTGTDG